MTVNDNAAKTVSAPICQSARWDFQQHCSNYSHWPDALPDDNSKLYRSWQESDACRPDSALP